jgi:hypothetical protein
MAVTKEDAKKVFDEMDTDKSGFIEANEFDVVMGSLGEPLTSAEVKAALAIIDTSGDHKISFDEFFKWYGDENRQKSEKTGMTLNLLKAKLLIKKSKKYYKENKEELLTRAKSDAASAITVSLGTFDKAAFSVTIAPSSDMSAIPKDVIRTSDEEGRVSFALSAEMRCADAPGWREFVTKVAKALEFGAAGFGARERDWGGVKIEIPDEKDTIVRFSIGGILPGRQGRQVEQLANFAPMIANNRLCLELGVNPADLVAPGKIETVCLQDLFKVRARFTGGLPEIAGMFLPQIAEMIGAVGLAVADFEGLQDLIDNKDIVNISLGGSLEKVASLSPIPLDAPASQMIPPEIFQIEDPQLKMALAALRAALVFLGRDLAGVSGFKLRALCEGSWIGTDIKLDGFEIAKFQEVAESLFKRAQASAAAAQ